MQLIMRQLSSLLLPLLLPLLLSVSPATAEQQRPVARLDYGTFEGAYSAAYNVNYWRKIPFAAPPVGENRFRAPQPPVPVVNGTYDSDQPFDLCVQRTVNGSEDCLFLGLYSRPWKAPESLRPVVIFFHGGGFIRGGGPFEMPPGGYPTLNVSHSTNLLFIYPNYRVNAFGFLPGAEMAASPTTDLNVGLLDQHAVLRWTSRYIRQFGGDPDDVTIWGQSAGAGSVVAQAIANGRGGRPKLFRAAVASSPFWSKTYRGDGPESQRVYDTFAEQSGCAGPESLRCLKGADVQVLRDAAAVVQKMHQYDTMSFTFGPVIDGEFLDRPLSEAAGKGDLDVEVGYGVYNTHEGENFVPPGFLSATSIGTPAFNSSTASFDEWLRGYLPGLSSYNIQRVKALYPATGSAKNIPIYNTSYVRAGLVYRDTVLACPAYWMASAAKQKSYVAEYTILPATHGSDVQYWSSVNAVQKTQPLIYEGFTGAFASLFQTGDPNENKLTNATQPGVPDLWQTGKQFVIRSDGLGNQGIDDELAVRCAFWREVAAQVPM
ncbi:uncharacterized protein L3040_009184 [Drepanopeziza brunnea f. sp. 'multigermtubi']|uniref:uncharacterized protein n=1 Tax=Drepanopeziza brunnea f. sp. 'multigermtubi' TaxID=698441 RepID=UPI00238A850D|nr:hypothetical protein L3040_009184 [Drepanopeziza brunnea f. sp. 'multigermtubi']